MRNRPAPRRDGFVKRGGLLVPAGATAPQGPPEMSMARIYYECACGQQISIRGVQAVVDEQRQMSAQLEIIHDRDDPSAELPPRCAEMVLAAKAHYEEHHAQVRVEL